MLGVVVSQAWTVWSLQDRGPPPNGTRIIPFHWSRRFMPCVRISRTFRGMKEPYDISWFLRRRAMLLTIPQRTSRSSEARCRKRPRLPRRARSPEVSVHLCTYPAPGRTKALWRNAAPNRRTLVAGRDGKVGTLQYLMRTVPYGEVMDKTEHPPKVAPPNSVVRTKSQWDLGPSFWTTPKNGSLRKPARAAGETDSPDASNRALMRNQKGR
ncbi:hypothetical protein F4780DRAFT_758739 [Xylariomycetidae sp. FL0641]|nr:hypothetical protein F4780DRAFT_758739 [Xylariomycetidae sp. FL0641]